MVSSVSFSTDELVALARRLGLPPLPALGPDPLDGLATPLRERVLDAADRSLVARNVVDAQTGAVLPVIATLLGIIAEPRVLARVARRRGDERAMRYFAATEDVTVEVRARAFGVHELRPFATVDVLAEFLDAAGIGEGAGAPGPPARFDLAHDALLRAYEAAARADRPTASGALRDAGLDAAAADDFLGREPRAWTMATLTVLHRPSAHRVEGGEVTSIDTCDRSLWSVTRVDATRVAVERTTLEQVAGDLLAQLPVGVGAS